MGTTRDLGAEARRISAADALARAPLAPLARLALTRRLEGTYTVELERVSAAWLASVELRAADVGEVASARLAGGNDALARALAAELPGRLRLGCAIRELRSEADAVQLRARAQMPTSSLRTAAIAGSRRCRYSGPSCDPQARRFSHAGRTSNTAAARTPATLPAGRGRTTRTSLRRMAACISPASTPRPSSAARSRAHSAAAPAPPPRCSRSATARQICIDLCPICDLHWWLADGSRESSIDGASSRAPHRASPTEQEASSSELWWCRSGATSPSAEAASRTGTPPLALPAHG